MGRHPGGGGGPLARQRRRQGRLVRDTGGSQARRQCQQHVAGAPRGDGARRIRARHFDVLGRMAQAQHLLSGDDARAAQGAVQGIGQRIHAANQAHRWRRARVRAHAHRRLPRGALVQHVALVVLGEALQPQPVDQLVQRALLLGPEPGRAQVEAVAAASCLHAGDTPADEIARFEHDDIGHAQPLQQVGRVQAAQAGADNDDACVLHADPFKVVSATCRTFR